MMWRHEALMLKSVHHLHIYQLPCQLLFKVNHRLLISVLLQILSDLLVLLLLLLITQFTDSFVIPLLCFHHLILEKFQLFL